MKSRQVCWLEGALVLPHHFQAEITNLRDWANANTNWTTPFHYGLCLIDYELGFDTLVIARLKARLRDGSMISLPENATIQPFVFKKQLEQAGVNGLTLFLTIPEYRPGRQNATRVGESESPDDDRHRFFIQQSPWFDMNHEDDERPIDFYDFNVRVKSSTSAQPPDGFTSIPLLRILPASGQDKGPKVDPQFFPPLLSCGCWPEMKRLLGQIESLLAGFIQQQADQLTKLDGWNQLTQPAVQKAITRLNAANSAYPVLSQLISLTQWSEVRPLHVLHPYQVFLELARLVGQLGIAQQGWTAPAIPTYDHDQLGAVFRRLQTLLEQLLTPYGPTSLEELPFVGTVDWLEISIARWVQDPCDFYIGVTSELSLQQVQRSFSLRHLDWKLGSRSTIARIYKNAEPGLRLAACGDCPPDLPHVSGRTYFRIEACGDYWDEVKKDPVLALRLNPRYVQGSFAGANRVTVIDLEGNPYELGFWLYVVKNASLVSNQGDTAHPVGD